MNWYINAHLFGPCKSLSEYSVSLWLVRTKHNAFVRLYQLTPNNYCICLLVKPSCDVEVSMYQYEEDFFLLFLLHMTKASTKVDKYTKGFYQVDNIFTNSAPLGQVGHRGAMSVCGDVCLWFCAIGCSFFRGLSLALRSHDQIPASHWSTPPAPPLTT